jgi:uncharacterized protein involved in outer membrane biogenesis
VKGSLGAGGAMDVEASGKYHGETIKANLRFPELQADISRPIRFEGKGSLGTTHVAADGVAAGKQFESLDLNVKASGQSLKHLSKITGALLPDTPPFTLAGHLQRDASDWRFDPFNGKVGDSDLAGNVLYRKGEKRPFLQANLRSNLLDFDDLGPLIGAPPKTAAGETASAEQKQKAAQVKASDKVIPHTEFKTERWSFMDADVKLTAKKVRRPKQLPIDSLQTHLVLKDSRITLEPLNFGFAGGRITSVVKLDGTQKPMQGDIRAEAQGVKLAQLFPTLKSMDEAFGTLYGRAELVGRGNSIGGLLDTSNGKITVAANGGRVSQFLTELLEIDLQKAAMLLGTRKQQVDLRCAVGSLKVKDGIAQPENFVVDTSETNVQVKGSIDLGEEKLALETHAKGKSPSFLTLRSPIEMEGTFKKPNIHPKAGPIVAQAGAAAALAAVAPPLAIVPFMSRGSGKDADCDTLLAEARKEGAVKKAG